MFKSLTLFKIKGLDLAAGGVKPDLEAGSFAPCGPTQRTSIGFVPPRGLANSPLVETIGGQHILRVAIQDRILPASVVARRVNELAAKVEQETARKPGAKRRRELKDEAILDLLPQAFTRDRGVWVWVCPTMGLLAIDTTTNAVIDSVTTLLSKFLPGLQLYPWLTNEAPAKCMAAWLLDGVPPHQFGIGRDCTLQSPDMQSAAVRYTRHGLDGQDIQDHLAGGKQVKELALTWKDRVHFVLREYGQIKRIEFEDSGEQPAADVDAFDADVTLTTGLIACMLGALTEAMGGLSDLPEQACS